MKLYIALLITLILSCKNQPKKQVVNAILSSPYIDTIVKKQPVISQGETTELREFFVDSVNMGKRTKNKIELSKFRTSDSNYVVIKFYSKTKNNSWLLKQQFEFEKDVIKACNTQLSDFDNDGCNDMTYSSSVGARSVNEIRKLFIYDKREDTLIYIKNSELYPNMRYNKELKCLDAFLVYGGCTTVFLKIKGDSLQEFANVELSNGLTVTRYDNYGNPQIIFQDTTNKAGFIRYKSFQPLKESDD